MYKLFDKRNLLDMTPELKAVNALLNEEQGPASGLTACTLTHAIHSNGRGD
jgi:hypothetical protein